MCLCVSGGDNTGMIVGIVGAVLAVLVLGLGLAAYCWKIRNGREYIYHHTYI